MRLKSSIYVSAILRTEQSAGAFGTIIHKGSEEAGAVFFVHLKPDGTADFFAPAPQSMMGEADQFDRLFERTGVNLKPDEIDAKIQKQLKFDRDCWIVEIEKSSEITSFATISSDS